MVQRTLTRGRLAEHPVWARALASDEAAAHLILPVIVSDAVEDRERVADAPSLERLSITELVREARRASAAGMAGLLVFGMSERKDPTALVARHREHVVDRAVRAVKDAVPEIGIATDVCVCAYTDHGQCVLFGDGDADVAGTLEVLQEIAVHHARAGADLVIPSGMLDGSAAAVRVAMAAEHPEVPVAATLRLESAFYGAHRIAVGAMPIGERAVPLLAADDDGPALARARRELLAGADALVVKPGLPTLDLVHSLSASTDRPVISFHTADEHALVVSAAELIDVGRAEREAVVSSRRSGASLVISYGAWSVVEAT